MKPKRLLLLIFFCSIFLSSAYNFLQKNFETEFLSTPDNRLLAENFLACEPATNINLNYQPGMSVAELSWDSDVPENGWIILFGHQGTIDINWFLSDPQNYENPETNFAYTNTNPHHIYVNMFHPGTYEFYIVSDCGGGLMYASESYFFEMQEKGEEIVEGGCETPFNVNAVQMTSTSVELSWEPNDGELYQIAWGPFGMEMNEGYFDDPQTGSVIVSENPYLLQFHNPGAQEPHGIFVRKYCGENLFSEWTVPFCAPPTGLESIVTGTEVIFNWMPTGQEFVWQVAYGPQDFDPNSAPNMINVYDNPTASVLLSTLEQGIVYEFFVRANCTDFSEWAGPGSFETIFLPCNPVENTFANHITHQSADIYWTPVSSENQWQVMYGLAPFNPDEAITVDVTNIPKVILYGLEPSTAYELKVIATCPSGETSEGEIIQFTTAEDDIYCIPYFLMGCTYDPIDHFILDGENDTRIFDINTGCSDSNYYKNLDEFVDLAPGNTYFARVSHGNFPISGDHLAIWIDFNDDAVFDNETERVGEGSLASGGFTHVNFSIPEGANPGFHRVRFMLAFNAYSYQLTPCNDEGSISTNGEVHDYMVNILALDVCNNAVAGTIMEDFEICSGEEFSITTMGASQPAEQLIRKWQSSPANQNNWTDVPGGLLPTTHIYDGIEEDTDFRYVVTCTLTGEESISEVLRVTMATNCYCKPTSNCAGPGGLQINRVLLAGETVLLDNITGCDGGGYGDHTIKFPPDLKQEETYTLSVTANNASLSDDKIKAWIDFNDNKVFEAGEVIMDFPGGLYDYTVSSEFAVPADVPPGLYRMRIRIGWWGSPTLQGCSTLGWGETEDYLVKIIPGENFVCVQPSDINVEQESDLTVATVTWSPGANETQWEVVYGLSGFDPNEAEPIEVSGEPELIISDLELDEVYDVYVRAICIEDYISDWQGPVTFSTETTSVTDMYFENFSYYPVPTDNILSMSALIAIEEVKIFNSFGQQLLYIKPTKNTADIDISTLSSGVYFMEVQLSGKSKVYKIVRK